MTSYKPWALQHMFVELINFEDPILKNDISPNIQLDSLFLLGFFGELFNILKIR
jgi:hypothetical protein